MTGFLRVLLCAVLAGFALPAAAATFTVLNTNDSGVGSFRQALLDANASPGADTIDFNIPGAGVHVIAPTAALPVITDPVTIDGYTQPGSSPNTNALGAGINAVLRIELNLPNSGQIAIGAGGAGTTIRGLALHSAVDNISVSAANVTIAGNFIGTDASGTTALPSTLGGFGIRHNSGSNLTIGGPNAADRNLISGDTQGSIIIDLFTGATGHLIQGNYIGTDVTGTTSLARPSAPGLVNTNHATIVGNLISGNSGGGAYVGDNSVFQGNLVGTQRNGTSALPNGNFGGVYVNGDNTVVGGANPGQPNVIAFNNGAGVVVRINQQNDLISRNVIYANTLQGISLNSQVIGTPLPNDLGDADTVAGNDGQNYPVITSVVLTPGSAAVSGTFNSLASTTFTLEFFANALCGSTGYGQGQTYIGSAQVTTDGSGNASFGPLNFAIPVGQTVITATATDPANNTSEFSQCLVAPPTTTAVVSSVNPSTVGQSVTFTATVTGASPTGTVQFFDGAASLGTSAVAGSQATLSTSALTQGSHPVTAVYSGDINNQGSTSPVLTQVVNGVGPGATTTAVVSSLNPSTFGQSVTFTATVAGASPTGSVQFFDGATSLGTAALAGNQATLASAALTVGSHAITAVYSGDADDATSTSTVLTQIVNPVVTPPPIGVEPIPALSAPLLALLSALVGALGLGVFRRRR